jgi:hypothetical protein
MQLDAQLAGSGARAALLRDSLQWSERLNKDVSGVLDAYTARLADLRLAVAPVTQRTQVRPAQAQRLPSALPGATAL